MSKAVAVAWLTVLAAGCLDRSDPCARDPMAVDPDGTVRGYVIDRIDLPGNSAEAHTYGLDIDYWYEGAADNQLGQVLGAIAEYAGYDLDVEANALIDAGAILHLFELRATSLTDADGVGLRIGQAIDADGDPTDNFSGDEPLGFDPGRSQGDVSGTIINGYLDLRVGTAPVAVTFPGLDAPYFLPLIEARVAAELVTETEIRGVIGGGIPQEVIDTSLLPILHDGLTRIIARDCPAGTCESGSFGDALLRVFDVDHDGTMTLAELRDSSLTQSLLAPDLDLRRDDGEPQDACADSRDADALSVGLGFHAVRARL